MPYSSLGKGTETVGSFLPYTHLTIWLKQVLFGDASIRLKLPEDLREVILGDFFSAKNIGFCGLDVPLGVMLGACGVLAAGALAAAWVILKKRIGGR
ncbi:MAG: hypothetical protein LBJ12_06690 [Oscillospiraceae bacterium]|jgi:hypothetical protein|nr:hypothetical protein [Oscillospiraceae bacterium]